MSKQKKRVATCESAVRRDLRTPLYRMRVTADRTKYDRKRTKRVSPEHFRNPVFRAVFRKCSGALAAVLLAVVSSQAAAISVEDYFSVQKFASAQNVDQKNYRSSINGVHSGLHDAFYSALFLNNGVLLADGQPVVCVDNLRDFTVSRVRDAIRDTIGTYEQPRLSPNALSAVPLGMHALRGLQKAFPCQ